MASSKKVDRGLDPKSIAINIATTLFFFLPIAAYFDASNARFYCEVVGWSMALALLIPPFGWLRPHPYSDFAWNKPVGHRD